MLVLVVINIGELIKCGREIFEFSAYIAILILFAVQAWINQWYYRDNLFQISYFSTSTSLIISYPMDLL